MSDRPRFVAIHTIHFLGPGNPNRGEDGEPKECMFGGSRRPYISSQARKRPWRLYMESQGLPAAERSRLLRKLLVSNLVRLGRDQEEAGDVVRAAFEAIGIAFSEEHPEMTETLLYVGRDEIQRIAETIHEAEHWDALLDAASEQSDPALNKTSRRRRATGSVGVSEQRPAHPGTGKKAKRSAPGTAAVRAALEKALDEGSRAAALACFGRMLADRPNLNVTGAVQVSFTVGVNHLHEDRDWWSAVDTLAEPGEGSGMISEAGAPFASNGHYGYVGIDVDHLVGNLDSDLAGARAAFETLLYGISYVLPSGKANSMYCHALPSLVMTQISDHHQPMSLANAFLSPVKGYEKGLLAETMGQLQEHYDWARTSHGAAMLGRAYVAGQSLNGAERMDMPDLIERVSAELFTR